LWCGGSFRLQVTISPDPTPKGEYREVMSKLVSEYQHTELGGRFPAFDGRDSLFTAGALPFDIMKFKVTLSACADKRYVSSSSLAPCRSLRRCDANARRIVQEDEGQEVQGGELVIKHAAAISLLQLRMLLAGYPTDIPAQALQVLDNVLRDVVFNKRDDME